MMATHNNIQGQLAYTYTVNDLLRRHTNRSGMVLIQAALIHERKDSTSATVQSMTPEVAAQKVSEQLPMITKMDVQ